LLTKNVSFIGLRFVVNFRANFSILMTSVENAYISNYF